jgi:hypothetical protein
MTKIILSNSATGTHACNITKYAEEEITAKYLLGKFGTSADKVAICGVSDLPIGVVTDEAAVGDVVNVALLGSPDTLKVMAGSPITAGTRLVPAAGGKVQPLPSTAGEYCMVGIALTSAVAGEIVEFMSCVPQQYVTE